MCGICGFSNFYDTLEYPGTVIEQMKGSIRHRGCDQDGSYNCREVFLGHCRLSIVDLEKGAQPMSNEDGSIWITLNGEIYNHLALKNDLMSRHRFITDSDTEVVIHLYEELNEKCLDRLDGMFSFCIWDKNKRKLFCARDRFGKKPFYYTLEKGEFIFSSELKGILKYPGLNRGIDITSLYKYLTYEYVPSPATIFQGIFKLPAAHYLIFHNDKVTINNYWDFTLKKVIVLPLEEYIERMEYLLRRAIQKRLMSDVPLGIFLSGGIDSSSVGYYMSKLMPAHLIKSFSIGFKEPSFDESYYSTIAAGFLNTDHHHKILDSAVMRNTLPVIVKKLDEPFADASIIPTYLLSNFAKKYITVALSGDGVDELFCGYDTFIASKLSFYYEKTPRFLDNFLRKLAQKIPVSMENFSLDFKIKQFLKGMDYERCFRNQVWLGSFSAEQLRALFNENKTNPALEIKELYKDISGYQIDKKASDGISALIYFYIKFYLQDDILTKIDRAGMMNSLEVRCPYLDLDLVELVNSIPVHFKLKGFTTKYILKKMLKGKLPDKIINRNKKGFGMPIAQWLRGPLKSLLLDVLSEQQIKNTGYFHYPYIKLLIDEHFSGVRNNYKQLWTLFMFQLWHNEWAIN